MEMTRERYQSAQEEKKQLTLKVEELERLEIRGSLAFFNIPFLLFFQGIETASVLFQFPTCLQDSVHLPIPQGSLISSYPLRVICFCSSTCCECC